MTAIDRDQLVTDAKTFLPAANVLSDTELRALADHVVDFQIPADDDVYYSEALCKLLRAAGVLNRSKASVDLTGKKREKSGGVEIERFEATGSDVWSNYLKSLSDICPILPGGGYTVPRAIGIDITPGDAFVINDCPDETDLIL